MGILPKCKNNKGVVYYNVPCCFDIETTSFEVQSLGKQSIMYIWTLSINGIIIQGRKWEEFVELCEYLSYVYGLHDKRILVIYVHNLAFEFQFMHKWFEWLDVFSLEKREPIKALTSLGIEFKCSYKLSGYSLAKLDRALVAYDIKKLVGDLDYSKKRNQLTELTKQELEYTYNDVQVVVAYIDEYIQREEFIYNIPNTKTGEVRRYCRNQCFYGDLGKKKGGDVYKAYRKLINALTLDEKDYTLIRTAFAGGFTHANAVYVGDIINNVYSFDFTSSYPAVMIAEKYPMSSPRDYEVKNIEDFIHAVNNYACVFTIEFYNIEATKRFENYISKSHCEIIKSPIINNGRVVRAEMLRTTINELDFKIISQYYRWDSISLYDFKVMNKGYLPTEFVKSILYLYNDKTRLKDVAGMEIEYLLSKERINSAYGMAVTDICRPKIEYSPIAWTSEPPNITEVIKKNNESAKRFLYYPWGVWVTAYARYNLFTAITELGDDYVYSDTDSVKFINYNCHKQYFDNYNTTIRRKLLRALKYHKLSPELIEPENNKGKKILLGAWDDEGVYTRFKTLGAKRYMVEKNGEIKLTVAGLNKGKAIEYMKKEYGDKVFENFEEGLYIPATNTNKLTHTYIDDEMNGVLTDYQGHTCEYHEKSGVHLSPADYTLSIDKDFLNYFLGIKDFAL